MQWWWTLYAPVALLGCYRLWLNWHQEIAAMALYIMVLFGSFSFIASCFFQDIWWLNGAFSMAGDIFIAIAFFLIMHNWSVISRRMDSVRTTGAPLAVMTFIGMSALVFAFDALLFGVSLFLQEDSMLCTLQVCAHLAKLLVGVLSVILFPYYAHRMRCVLCKVGEDSPRRMRNIVLISIIAVAYFIVAAIGHGIAASQLYTACILAPVSWILFLSKCVCITSLLLVLPWRPTPSRHGYIRLRSNCSS